MTRIAAGVAHNLFLNTKSLGILPKIVCHCQDQYDIVLDPHQTLRVWMSGSSRSAYKLYGTTAHAVCVEQILASRALPGRYFSFRTDLAIGSPIAPPFLILLPSFPSHPPLLGNDASGVGMIVLT